VLRHCSSKVAQKECLLYKRKARPLLSRPDKMITSKGSWTRSPAWIDALTYIRMKMPGKGGAVPCVMCAAIFHASWNAVFGGDGSGLKDFWR
jgi:hypothetical protein